MHFFCVDEAATVSILCLQTTLCRLHPGHHFHYSSEFIELQSFARGIHIGMRFAKISSEIKRFRALTTTADNEKEYW